MPDDAARGKGLPRFKFPEWGRIRFTSHPGRDAITEITAGVSRSANAAVELIMEAEPDFLRLAQDLKDVFTSAAEIGRSTDRQILSLRGSIAETRLVGSDGLAGTLLQGLRAALADTEAELESLNKICSELLRLVHLGDRIGLTAVFLNTARYSFRVESARTEATRQSFGAFAEELEPLAHQVGAVGEAISTGAGAAHAELSGLVKNIRQDSAQLRAVTAETGLAVENTCRRGQELLDSSSSLLEESRSRALQRQQHADNAVYHVQFGDIVRQKIEHVAAALNESAQILGQIGGGDRRIASLAHADHALAIQEGQIELIASEIRSTREGLPDAFAGLGEETKALAASLRGMGPDGDSNDALGELKTQMQRMTELESRGRAMQGQSRKSYRRALETSRDVSRCMEELREINFRMHLQSLNAIIKTEWLGEDGRTLGILSSHMHTVFRESSGLVADTAGVLESIVYQKGDAVAELQPDPEHRDGDLGTSLDHGMSALSRLRQEFGRTIEAAHEMAALQESQLERARASIDFLGNIEERLQNLGDELRGLRKRITPLLANSKVTRDPLSLSHGFAAHTSTHHYTMESEREVHRRHTNSVAVLPDGSEPAPESAAVQAGGEWGDNVDFF